MNDNPARRRSLIDILGDTYRRLGPILWPNWLAMVGSGMALSFAVMIVSALAIHLIAASLNQPLNPYFDLVGFLVLPGFFTLGLALIVAGRVLENRRLSRGEPQQLARHFDAAAIQRRAVLLTGGTLVAVVILSVFSYQAYHFTDSPRFCTELCHTVMRPEAAAYRRSPHARVECVSCHIGPGASWFVRAKLSGLRQVYAVATHTYSTPIPTPVAKLRPAQETCEVCHWPSRFQGPQLRVRQHFEPDRDNTATTTAMILKIGGSGQSGIAAQGIHWHVDPENQVRYRYTDRERQHIVEVVQRTPQGENRYLLQGTSPQDSSGSWRVMDCVDCHNRPTHIFELPAQAVDAAMAEGRLDRRVPWLRLEAVRVLQDLQPDDATATHVAERLTAAYQASHPDDLPALRDALPATAPVLAAILERNIFPKMKVEWGTYRSNLQHFDVNGEMANVACFRCHDEAHATADGKTISQDCELCHSVVADHERDPKALPPYVAEFIAR